MSITEDASLSLHRAVKVAVVHLLAGKNVVIDGMPLSLLLLTHYYSVIT